MVLCCQYSTYSVIEQATQFYACDIQPVVLLPLVYFVEPHGHGDHVAMSYLWLHHMEVEMAREVVMHQWARCGCAAPWPFKRKCKDSRGRRVQIKSPIKGQGGFPVLCTTVSMAVAVLGKVVPSKSGTWGETKVGKP